jgi:hypothetical protein
MSEIIKGVCRVCGCTDDRACNTPQGPCFWVYQHNGHLDESHTRCSGCFYPDGIAREPGAAK